MRVERIGALVSKLRKLKEKAKKKYNGGVVVGYTQHYGLYVHENLAAHHEVGNAKFLEGPARRLGPVLQQIITSALARGKTMEQALVLAGLRLQRESQQEVPIDTGALRASAFTALERDASAAFAEAFDRSEKLRRETLAKRVLKRK